MKERINIILEYVLVTWVALSFYSVYFSNKLFFYVGKKSLALEIILLVLCVLTKSQKPQIKINVVLPYCFFAIIMLPFNSDILFFIMNYCILLPLFYIYFSYSSIKGRYNCSLLYKFSSVVTIIGAFSFIMWLLVSQLGILRMNIMIPDDWSPFQSYINSYGLVYFETQTDSLLGFEVTRNTGFYEEGPVFNLVLCLALGIELFLKKNLSKAKTLILTVTILSTLTTTGQFFLFISWFVYLYRYSYLRKKTSTIILMSFPFVLYAVIEVLSYIITEKQDTGSYRDRMIMFENTFNAFTESPIGGQGLMMYKGGKSNSLMVMLAEGGLLLGGLYLLNMVLLPLKEFLYNKNNERLFFFAATYFMIFIFTIGYVKSVNLMLLGFFMANLSNNRLLSLPIRRQ